MAQIRAVDNSMTRDVTGRVRAEEELRKLSRAVEQSPVTVVITDTDGTIEYVNPRFTETTGYSAEEAIGQNPRVLKSGHISADGYRELWETITAGRVWRGEFHNKKKNGELYWEAASISPITNAEGEITHFVGVKEDITRQKEAERALRQKEEQLRQSQKLDAVGQLAGGIAHEFNNLLQTIGGYSKFAMEGLSPDDERYQDLLQVQKATVQAASLTRQLLGFSRHQASDPQYLNPNEVVHDFLKMARPAIGERIAVEVIADQEVAGVCADSGQLQQILLNLCLNARDAMPAGGRLTIRTRNVHLNEDAVKTHTDLRVGHYVVISVTDTGCGMSRELQERIFEPFFTTKEVGQGTGLGLATVYGILQQHDGAIHVDSQPGRGTRFRVYLPAVQATTPVPYAEEVLCASTSGW